MQIITAREFLAQLRKLRKTYRLIDKDLESLWTLRDGPRPQDRRLSGIGVSQVYKARLPNTSAKRGSSGGFRVVYRVKGDTVVLLLAIWSKTHSSDLPDSEIRRIAKKY